MIRRYNNPLKARVWRPRIAEWMKKHFPDPKTRRNLSAVCLAGPELLEVEHIYKKLGFGHVVCVESDKGHYRRMCEKREEMKRDGHKHPEIDIKNMDVREYLATTDCRHDTVFLDFDGKSHLVVEDCMRSVTSRSILPEKGGILGFNVLGVREHLQHQLAMRARSDERLNEAESTELVLAAISWDPVVKELLKNKDGYIKRKTMPKAETENDLKDARSVFYTNLLLRSMFRGNGLGELTKLLVEDDIIRPKLGVYVEYVMLELNKSFVLRHVDMDALQDRVRELVAEVGMFGISEIHTHLREGFGGLADFATENRRVRPYGTALKEGDFLHYFVAKYLRPYLCQDILSLECTWGPNHMFTDMGLFVQLKGFEDRIQLGLREFGTKKGKVNALRPYTRKSDIISRSHLTQIKKTGNKLRAYLERFRNLCEGRVREVLSLDVAKLDPSLLPLTHRSQIERIVEREPLTTADDIYECYNVIGLNCNQVMRLVEVKLREMGLEPPKEKRKERLKIQIAARVELGSSSQEIEDEFYETPEYVNFVKKQLEEGQYSKGGLYSHLRPYIEREKGKILAKERKRHALSPLFEEFSKWADANIENSGEVKSMTESEIAYMEKTDEELSGAGLQKLLEIASGFSEFEPYAVNPFLLLRIAAATRRADRDEGLSKRLHAEAGALMEDRMQDLSRIYGRISFDGRGGKKIRVDRAHRALFLECFGYYVIAEATSQSY